MKGFTLIENLVMVSVLSVLLILVIPFQARVRNRYNLEMAVWQIHSEINHLKYQAVKDSVPYRFCIFSRGYIIEKYDASSSGWKKVDQKTLSGLWLEANNSPVFYPEGTVSNLATITIANSAGKYRLTVAISGRIKIIRLDGDSD
jgi:Tfp pilus assembly protein FimT